MEIKKTPKADLENKKSLMTEIGLVITLGIVLAAFEWSTTDVKIDTSGMIEEAAVEEEIVPITRQEEIKPPPPPPPPKMSDIINIVDDDVELDDELDLQDTEADEGMETMHQQEIAVVEEEEETQEVFFIVEEMPVFPGGEEALRKFIAQSVKYPVIAQENGIQGRVFVSFVVNQKGEVTNVKVARPFDPNLDKEAVRVVQSMPKWSPGKQRGKAVKVSYTVPINFVLQ